MEYVKGRHYVIASVLRGTSTFIGEHTGDIRPSVSHETKHIVKIVEHEREHHIGKLVDVSESRLVRPLETNNEEMFASLLKHGDPYA